MCSDISHRLVDAISVASIFIFIFNFIFIFIFILILILLLPDLLLHISTFPLIQLVHLLLNQTPPGFQQLLQLQSQSLRNKGQSKAETDLFPKQLLNKLIDIGQLIYSNTVPHLQLPIVHVEWLQ